MKDLPVEAFLALRTHFFDEKQEPRSFSIRHKRNTQDDPLDEYLSDVVFSNINATESIKASPLITPDLVVYRPSKCRDMPKEALENNLDAMIAIEVKKLNRGASGRVARSSGLDYNTTPPCGRVRIYDKNGSSLNIRSFYLFVCLEEAQSDSSKCILTALVLADGNIINRDFDYYLSIVGEREKKIGVGSYEDGINRQRPMLVFANPLGAQELDRAASLIHPNVSLDTDDPRVSKVFDITRTSAEQQVIFGCYRTASDVSSSWQPQVLVDPFPTPAKRTVLTQRRGMLRLPFNV